MAIKAFQENEWALILGGSSGFGLATAKKLSSLGMNICVIHRDRKGSMPQINSQFDIIKQNGCGFFSLNEDALSPEGQERILAFINSNIKYKGSIKLLLHSIAFGNLKPIAPVLNNSDTKRALDLLANNLKVDAELLRNEIIKLFPRNIPEFYSLVTPSYGEILAKDEDIAGTCYSMGTSLLTWTQQLFQHKLFSSDTRVIGLTSEGNQIAWRGYAAVSVAKAALEAISRAIATEFAPYGIRCNIVQAGVTDTPALRAIPGSERLRAFAKLRNPFKRLTTPEDIANVIALLCLNEASWINGTVICADGGESISSY